jgi:hypothetical protein
MMSSTASQGGADVYDVLYRGRGHSEKTIATGLAKDAACDLARAEARRLHVGRMFAAGSDVSAHAETVLIVESKARDAA